MSHRQSKWYKMNQSSHKRTQRNLSCSSDVWIGDFTCWCSGAAYFIIHRALIEMKSSWFVCKGLCKWESACDVYTAPFLWYSFSRLCAVQSSSFSILSGCCEFLRNCLFRAFLPTLDFEASLSLGAEWGKLSLVFVTSAANPETGQQTPADIFGPPVGGRSPWKLGPYCRCC